MPIEAPARPEPVFQHQTDLDQLRDDIASSAELAGAPFDASLVQPVLDAYREWFCGSPVSFRTSTRPRSGRELNVRYVELRVPHDPYPIARERGFVTDQSHPIDRLMDDIQSRFPILGYGVDFGAHTGFEKIWPFFPHRPQPVDVVAGLPSLPESVRSHAARMARHRLDLVSLFGVDYRSRTVNLYFMKEPGSFTAAQITEMADDLGFAAPSAELLGYCTQAIPVYCTFSWESSQVERLCFGTVAAAEEVPTHLAPVIERYVRNAPFACARKTFILSIALARHNDYIKIENDYTGSMVELMKARPG